MKDTPRLLMKPLILALLALFLLGGAAMAEVYLWPVPSLAVNTSITQKYSSSHPAIDIGVSNGSKVVATKSGTVVQVYSGCQNYSQSKGCSGCSPNCGRYEGICNWGYGNGVVIKHSDGTMSCYAHMSSVSVSKGSSVSQGQQIGYSGSSGRSTGPHLHFEVISGHSSNQGTYYGHSDKNGISAYNVTFGNPEPVDECAQHSCSTAAAGWYRCTSKDGLNINSGHNWNSYVGYMPSDAWVWVSKAATDGTRYAHVTYNGISGISSTNYLSKTSSYTVYLNDNGGSGGQGSLTMWKDVPNEPNSQWVRVPSRTNYTFLGYYYGNDQLFDASGHRTYHGSYWSNSAWSYAGGLTLTAKWQLNVVYVTSVDIHEDMLGLTEGESVTLTTTVLPENATDRSLNWVSSDPSVATVSGGVVKAIAPGYATISAKARDGSEQFDFCIINVYSRVTDLTLNRHTQRLSLKAPYNATRLMYTLEPLANVNVTVESSDPDVAVVSSDGRIIAVGEGQAYITASVCNGPSDTCLVTVVPEMTTLTLPDGLSSIGEEAFTGSDAEVIVVPNGVEHIGSRAFADNPKLSFVVVPASAYDFPEDAIEGDPALTVVWGYDDTFRLHGENWIPYLNDDAAAYVPVRRLTLPDSVDLTVDEQTELTAQFYPLFASNQSVRWESSDPAIATVNGEGIVTAVDIGTSKITVTALDGSGISASCNVKVGMPKVVVNASSVAFEASDIAASVTGQVEITGIPPLSNVSMFGFSLCDSGNQELGSYMLPANGQTSFSVNYALDRLVGFELEPLTDYRLRFVALVSGYPFYSEVQSFRTLEPVPRLVLDQTALTLKVGAESTLQAMIYNHEPEDILWRTSNSSVVYVVGGKLTARGEGTATITARLINDTAIQASCDVTVVP